MQSILNDTDDRGHVIIFFIWTIASIEPDLKEGQLWKAYYTLLLELNLLRWSFVRTIKRIFS